MNGTDFRIFYEKYAIYRLAEYLCISPKDIRHLSAESIIAPYDLEYKKIKYDVKYSHPSQIEKKDNFKYWDFSLRKNKGGKRSGQDGLYCDFFVLIGMKNGIPKKLFLVPADKAPTNHIRISVDGNSKYKEYELSQVIVN